MEEEEYYVMDIPDGASPQYVLGWLQRTLEKNGVVTIKDWTDAVKSAPLL